jgi:hypothetical protein
MQALVRYSWAGNIRELQNVIERAVLVSNGPNIEGPTLGSEEPPSDCATGSFGQRDGRRCAERWSATQPRCAGRCGAQADHRSARAIAVDRCRAERCRCAPGIEAVHLATPHEKVRHLVANSLTSPSGSNPYLGSLFGSCQNSGGNRSQCWHLAAGTFVQNCECACKWLRRLRLLGIRVWGGFGTLVALLMACPEARSQP